MSLYSLLRKLSVLLLLLTIAAVSMGQATPVDYTDHALVKVEILNRTELDTLREISPDIWTEHIYAGMPVLARIPPGAMDKLIGSGLDFQIVDEDLGPELSSHYPSNRQKPPAGSEISIYEEYKTYDEIKTILDDLASACPDGMSCKVISVGESYEGEDIWAIRLRGAMLDGGEGESAVLYQGMQHAREWIAGSVMLCLADYIVNNYATDSSVSDIVDKVSFFIIPCVNPDGYRFAWDKDRLWRHNRRVHDELTVGVDLNRNWGVAWGYYTDGYPIDPEEYPYHGSGPFSEFETRAVAKLAEAHPEIGAVLDVHSAGELILMPWGYTYQPVTETDSVVLNSVGTEMVNIIQSVNDNIYTLEPGVELYPAYGTACDWYYGDQREIAYTVELSPGQDEFDNYGYDYDTGEYTSHFELNPKRIAPTCEETIPMLMYVAEWASDNSDFESTLEDAGIPPVDTDTEWDTSSDSESDTDNDTETESEDETDTGDDTDTGTDTDSDTDSDTDAENDPAQDDPEGGGESCGCKLAGKQHSSKLLPFLRSVFL